MSMLGKFTLPVLIATTLIYMSIEQNITVARLGVKRKIASENITVEYVDSEFPLAYYLIPEDDVHPFLSKKLDPRVRDQLVMGITGLRHFKLFIHPHLEAQYDYLKYSYNYIGPDKTEFVARASLNEKTLVVHNRNNPLRKSFVLKLADSTSTDSIVSRSDIEKSFLNELYFEKLGLNEDPSSKIKFQLESASLYLTKSHPGQPSKLSGQIIKEIPDFDSDKKPHWLSADSLISGSSSAIVQLSTLIEKSHLSSYQFIEQFLITNTLTAIEQLVFVNGMNYQFSPQSLVFEENSNTGLTGKIILQNLNLATPDLITIGLNQNPIENFLEHFTNSVDQIRLNYQENNKKSIQSSLQLIFDSMIESIAKNDNSLTRENINTLRSHFQMALEKTLKKHGSFKMNDDLEKQAIVTNEALNNYIDLKKEQKLWVELFPITGAEKYYLTPYALFRLSDHKISAVGFYTDNEYERFKKKHSLFNVDLESDL